MKKIFLSGFLTMTMLLSQAQQKPYYTQYVLNNYILNPAVTGVENYADIKLSYRDQWTSLEGAPVTSYFTFHKAIGKTDSRTTATSFSGTSSNPYKSNVMESYEPADPHHGIGFSIISDKAGYISRTTISASYAYHMPLNTRTSLAAGFNAGLTTVNLDRSKIVWGSLNPGDPAIGYNNGDLQKRMPELGAGLWIYDRDFFIGGSVLNIVPGKVRYVKNDTYGDFFKPHFFAQAGYRHFISEDFSVLPSIAVQYISPLPVFIHTNVKLQYRDLVWLGGGYRIKDQLSGMAIFAGMNVGNTMNVSYSYNSTMNSTIKTYVGNTHEVLLGFTIGKKEDSCPKNIW